MVKKSISLILLISMIFYCCTSTHMIKYDQFAYDDLNENLKGKEVSIILTNQDIKKGQNIEVMLDTTYWIEVHTVLKSRVPWIEDSTLINWSVSTSEIRGFNINNDLKAVINGAGAGFVIGAGLTYLLVKGENKYATSVLGGLVGMLLGLFIGPEIGYTEEYIINMLDSIGDGK